MLPSVIVEYDFNGNLTYVNPHGFKLAGYKPEDLEEGFHVLRLVAPEEHEKHYERIQRMMQGEKIPPTEYRLLRKDGSIFWGLVTSSLIHKDGEVVGVRTYTIDINERKQAEEELQDAKQKWMSLIENTNDFIMIIDDKGKIQYINRTIPPHTVNQVTGKTLYDFSAPENHEMIRQAVARVFETRKQESYTSSVKHPTGIQWFETTMVPIIEEEKVRSVMSFNKIITESKRAEEALKKAHDELEKRVQQRTAELLKVNDQLKIEIEERKRIEERLKHRKKTLQALLNAPTETAIMTDLEGVILAVNEIAAQRIGKSSEELIGLGMFDYLPRDIARSRKTKSDEVARTGTPVRFQDERDGRYYDNNIYPVFDAKGKTKALAIYAKDITDRKKAEKALKASVKEKELLLQEVHHRVKNNFEIISSLLDMSSMQTENREIQNLWGDTRNRIHSMALIHDQLYQNDRFDQIDMETHVRNMLDYLSHIYAGNEKGITSVIESSEAYLSVNQAIPCSLLLNELISNAFKHAFKKRRKGAVRVSINNSTDDTVLIRVKDDGDGIPEGSDFNNAKGLGLKLVRHLVNGQLNGEMRVNIDNGTEFQIEFKKLE